MDTTTQIFTVLLVVLVIAVSLITQQITLGLARRGKALTLRDIEAFTVIPTVIGASIEANRPLHLSFGSSQLGGDTTLIALASSELFYHVVRRAAIGDAQPILTVSDAATLPLAQDTLRRAYTQRNLLNRYQFTSARWYPSGGRSLAFAAALTGLIGDDRVSSNILVGSFGAELALIADAARRRGQTLIAASDQLEGQAIAYAVADYPLIGEELFRAGAYLDEDTTGETASATATDALRVIIAIGIVLILLATVYPNVAASLLNLGGG